MIRRLSIAALVACFSTATFAELWENLGSSWYLPPGDFTPTSSYNWQVKDTSGLWREFTLSYDEEGNITTNLKDVLGDVSQSVKTLSDTLWKATEAIVANARNLERIDREFEVLAKNLDDAFFIVFAEMHELKIRDTAGNESTSTISPTTEGLLVDNVEIPLDGSSLSYNGGKKIEVSGFANAGHRAVPMKYNSALGWMPLLNFFSPLFTEAQIAGIDVISLDGMIKHGECDRSLAEMIQGKKDGGAHVVLTKFGNEMHFTEIGEIEAGSVKVDGESLVTNAAGIASVKGWVEGMGNRHYFGTSEEAGEAGFWELPNATTNRVEGDEITITSNTEATPEGELKKLGLKGWSALPAFDENVPRFLAKTPDGLLGSIPMPIIAPTNDPCTCSSKWEKVETWTGWPLDEWGAEKWHGVPSRWLEENGGLDVDEMNYNALRLKGWGTSGGCSETLSGMLQNPNDSQRYTHKVLCYVGGALHYTPIGDALSITSECDNVTITTGQMEHQGQLCLAGVEDSSNAGKFLRRKESGAYGFEWADPPGGGGEFSVTGTDGVKASGTNVVFQAAEGCNIEVKAHQNGNKTITVTFGVYYQ